MKIDIKEDAENLLYNKEEKDNSKKTEKKEEKKTEKINKTVNKTVEKVENARKKMHKVHRYTRKIYKTQSDRALFSQETVDRILNQKMPFKLN
jgi:protein tyrosine/serine phosphatase